MEMLEELKARKADKIEYQEDVNPDLSHTDEDRSAFGKVANNLNSQSWRLIDLYKVVYEKGVIKTF